MGWCRAWELQPRRLQSAIGVFLPTRSEGLQWIWLWNSHFLCQGNGSLCWFYRSQNTYRTWWKFPAFENWGRKILMLWVDAKVKFDTENIHKLEMEMKVLSHEIVSGAITNPEIDIFIFISLTNSCLMFLLIIVEDFCNSWFLWQKKLKTRWDWWMPSSNLHRMI